MKGSLIGAVIGREWRTRVFKRSFLLATLLMPFLAVGFIALTVMLTEGTETRNRVLVEDMPGLITRLDAASGQFVPRCPGCFPCLLYTSPSPRDATLSRMPSSA